MKSKIFALIPARGGSKGIHKKNLSLLGGHSLVGWAVLAAVRSNCFSEVIVSSDSIEILDVASHYGATRMIKRPKELSDDKAKQISVIRHCMSEIGINSENSKTAVLLQPTFPFRHPSLIERAISLHGGQEDVSVISVSDVTYLNESTLYNGPIENLQQYQSGISSAGTLRQEFPSRYWRNGGIYVLNRKDILRDTLYAKRIIGIDCPRALSINIDEPLDLDIARNFLLTQEGQAIYSTLFHLE